MPPDNKNIELFKKIAVDSGIASDKMEVLTNAAKKAYGTIHNGSKQAYESLGVLNKAFESTGFGILKSGFEVLGKTIEANIAKVPIFSLVASDSFTSMLDPVNDANSSFKNFIEGLAPIQNNIENLLKVQTTAREAFTLFGGEINKVNEATSSYPQNLRKSAVATNLTTDALNSMVSSIKIIPGALEETDKEIGGIIKTIGVSMQPMAALATVSRAFGMSASESANMANNAYLKYGQNIDDTIKQMGKLANAQSQTGINIDIVRHQINEASSSLSIFGQKSSSAAGIWTTFISSLKDTNVPLESIGSMVSNVTQGLTSMSTENRAFIAMISGLGAGRSALGGALQMELNMRTPEGMERNLQALTSTLSQFTGGRIITIEEAVANPQLEMQFQVQRQMLAELNGITDREQQNRILQVLQQVQSGGIASIEGGRELQSLYESGKNIQENELSQLKKIEQVFQVSIGDAADRVIENLNNSIEKLVPKETREKFSIIPSKKQKTRRGIEKAKALEASAFSSLIENFDNKLVNFSESVIKSTEPLEERFKDFAGVLSSSSDAVRVFTTNLKFKEKIPNERPIPNLPKERQTGIPEEKKSDVVTETVNKISPPPIIQQPFKLDKILPPPIIQQPSQFGREHPILELPQVIRPQLQQTNQQNNLPKSLPIQSPLQNREEIVQPNRKIETKKNTGDYTYTITINDTSNTDLSNTIRDHIADTLNRTLNISLPSQ